MSRSSPTAPSGWSPSGAGLGTTLVSSLRSLSSENEWDFPGLSIWTIEICSLPVAFLLSQLLEQWLGCNPCFPLEQLLDPCGSQLPWIPHRQGLLLPSETIPEAQLFPGAMSLSPPSLTPSKAPKTMPGVYFQSPKFLLLCGLESFFPFSLTSHIFPLFCCTLLFPAVKEEFSSTKGRGYFPSGRQSQGFQRFLFHYSIIPFYSAYFTFGFPSHPGDPISAVSH